MQANMHRYGELQNLQWNVECINPDAQYGQWEVADLTDTIKTDDDLFFYAPINGHTYSITVMLRT